MANIAKTLKKDLEQPTVSSPTCTALLCVPSPGDSIYENSIERSYDCFYKLPKIIECFIERCNKELGSGYSARAWTINRAVTLFKGVDPIVVFDYDCIERDITYALDMAILETNT